MPDPHGVVVQGDRPAPGAGVLGVLQQLGQKVPGARVDLAGKQLLGVGLRKGLGQALEHLQHPVGELLAALAPGHPLPGLLGQVIEAGPLLARHPQQHLIGQGREPLS